jgi:hypothetical protein
MAIREKLPDFVIDYQNAIYMAKIEFFYSGSRFLFAPFG